MRDRDFEKQTDLMFVVIGWCLAIGCVLALLVFLAALCWGGAYLIGWWDA